MLTRTKQTSLQIFFKIMLNSEDIFISSIIADNIFQGDLHSVNGLRISLWGQLPLEDS